MGMAAAGASTMRAITTSGPGGPEVLTVSERPIPTPGPEDLLVRVRAIGVNRADALQRAGRYAPPPDVSDILGLELAGEVSAIGAKVRGFSVGDRVFGLVASGACAEFAVVDHGLAVPMPAAWDFSTAAAVIETFCTANETLFTLGRLAAGESVLIHAGGSGVGTSAIQMAKQAGAKVYVTAGSAEKIRRIAELGADGGIDYHRQDFADEIMRLTEGKGVDVVLDFIGASYLPRNIAVLRLKGRLVIAGVMGPPTHPVDTGPILGKRLQVLGFTLRPQTIAEKRGIVARFAERWMSPLAAGAIKPVIHATLPFDEIREAHRIMEANENFGKLVLTVA
jgi:NADPH:quinone reductase